MERADASTTLVICGPTCSGKSPLALRLAQAWDGEVVSADSVQVHRRLDIGSAKPTPEEREHTPHHMLDIVPIDGEYDAGRYGTDARRAIEDVHARGRKSVVCGGTGLYLRSLIYGLAGAPPRHDETRAALQERARELGAPALHAELALVDPAYAAKIHPNDSVRIVRALEVYQASGRTLTAWHEEQGPPTPQIAAKIVGIAPPRHELYPAIDARVDAMMAQGWLHEVFQILEDGYPPDLKSLGSLGYRHLVAHLQGGPSLEDTIALIKRDHRHYAKRQMTWFRGEPLVTWFTGAEAAFETLVAGEERVK